MSDEAIKAAKRILELSERAEKGPWYAGLPGWEGDPTKMPANIAGPRWCNNQPYPPFALVADAYFITEVRTLAPLLAEAYLKLVGSKEPK